MSRTTRREFAKLVAAAGVALPLAAEDAPKPSPLAAALTDVVRAEFGQFLSEEEMERVGKDFEQYAPYLANFRKFALTNADAP